MQTTTYKSMTNGKIVMSDLMGKRLIFRYLNGKNVYILNDEVTSIFAYNGFSQKVKHHTRHIFKESTYRFNVF